MILTQGYVPYCTSGLNDKSRPFTQRRYKYIRSSQQSQITTILDTAREFLYEIEQILTRMTTFSTQDIQSALGCLQALQDPTRFDHTAALQAVQGLSTNPTFNATLLHCKPTISIPIRSLNFSFYFLLSLCC